MKKFTLKELLDVGGTITDIPENINCWVDLPWIDAEKRIAYKNDAKSTSAVPSQLHHRVCKETDVSGLFYSIRKVTYDDYGKLNQWSLHPVTPMSRKNCDERGIAFLRSELQEYLKAFESPVVDLDRKEKEKKF